jgi:GntR family transcriptional regulator, transcriptional repressor for pyruvate dehydrogenase complex
VREAISRLQAASLVETRHGVGTFVVGMGDAATFRISPDQLGTLQDVIAVLELRIAVETESAALAAMRRSEDNLRSLRSALNAFISAVEEGRDAVGPDFQFHLEIAKATQNQHFVDLMGTLGGMMIPRARLEPAVPLTPERQAYLRRVNAEHENIVEAIRGRHAHPPGEQPGTAAAPGRSALKPLESSDIWPLHRGHVVRCLTS